MVKLHEVYERNWISNKLNNGDWDYWLIVEVIDMWEATGDLKQDQFLITVKAASPKAAGKKNVDSALKSSGEDRKSFTKEMIAFELANYGVGALLYQENGNDEDILYKKVVEKELPVIEGLFGFYMDKYQNRIGNTGWDFISGNIGFH